MFSFILRRKFPFIIKFSLRTGILNMQIIDFRFPPEITILRSHSFNKKGVFLPIFMDIKPKTGNHAKFKFDILSRTITDLKIGQPEVSMSPTRFSLHFLRSSHKHTHVDLFF